MDQRLVDLVISYHGPEIVDRLDKEQVPVQLPSFLSLPQQGTKCEVPPDEKFNSKLVAFIAKKASLLFVQHKRDHAPSKKEQDEDMYAVIPPLETFMGVPSHLRRDHFLKSVEPGDIVVGTVSAIQESGLVIMLLSLDNGKCRDINQLKICAFCPLREVPKHLAHESPLQGFAISDKVRGVVLSVTEKLIVSLRHSALPHEKDDVKIGLISEEDYPEQYTCLLDQEGGDYQESLLRSKGFTNPSNVSTLADMLCVKEDKPPSLMNVLCRSEYHEADYADSLRKVQSYRWAIKSVAEGVRYFKEGKHTQAMQHLNRALQIDEENVEGLVARGALYANNESYIRALEDFKRALEINPNHNNARKYTAETLVAHARSLLDEGKAEEAEAALQKALLLKPDNADAQYYLQKVQVLSQRRSAQPDAGQGDHSIHSPTRAKIPRNMSPTDECSTIKTNDNDESFDKTTETLRKLIEQEALLKSKKKKVPTATLR